MKTRIYAVTATLALACLLALGSTAMGAKGGVKGPPINVGENVNQMSFPAIFDAEISANWSVPALNAAVLGVDYSYGCDQEEFSGVYSYPNTSCVNNLMAPEEYYTADECIQSGHPCEGFALDEVYRIYWQKNPLNEWSADQDVNPGQTFVSYLDWGDALEAVSWNERSKIRVETQPYSKTTANRFGDSCENMANVAADDCKVGFHMSHVSGQGITEHWGVKATEEGTSFNYDTPYQIIKTESAKLNIVKLGLGSAECPSPGGGEDEGDVVTAAYDIPAVGDWTFDIYTEEWGWSEAAYTYRNESYSVETSVGGKYVYGYNLPMADVAMPEGVEKTGWWRLTFYDPTGMIQFDDPLVSAPGVPPEDSEYYYYLTAPPAVPSAARELPRGTNYIGEVIPEYMGAAELYQPVVDEGDNLTYLDICIVAKDQGGGGGGGGGGGNKPPAGGGGPGGGGGGHNK